MRLCGGTSFESLFLAEEQVGLRGRGALPLFVWKLEGLKLAIWNELEINSEK